jgi:hypothetical protein
MAFIIVANVVEVILVAPVNRHYELLELPKQNHTL